MPSCAAYPGTAAQPSRRDSANSETRSRDPRDIACAPSDRTPVQQLTHEERELAREIDQLVRKLAPQLLDQPGVGTLLGAQILLAWSHRGRLPNEAAFARLAGVAPIPASSGQTIRYRLDPSGDRKLNRTLHLILLTRKRSHPATIAYIERRLQEGKTRREATRCLKRYFARNLYRLLENPPPTDA